MQPLPLWDGPLESGPSIPPPAQNSPLRESLALPACVEAALWKGNQLGGPINPTLSTGFPSLDEQLVGGGWPCNGLTEILATQFSMLEWRLLAPALRQVCDAGRDIVIVGPPKHPYPPGLRQDGIDTKRLVWVNVDAPAERLWATEQAIKSNACGAMLAWLPQVRAEQIRRLQVLAMSCDAPVFLFRLTSVASDSSAAPLRVIAGMNEDWELQVQVLKRRGPPLEDVLHLPSIPGGVEPLMTPRLRYPSRLTSREPDRALVRPSTSSQERRTVPH